MSQAGDISAISGPVPPAVATSYTTDNGTAVPALNILDVRGIDSIEDNDNGIKVEGGLAETGAGNRIQIQLTNRIQGGATTVNATPTTAATFSASSTGTYIFEMKASAYNSTDTLGAGYSLFGTVRSNGTDTFLIGTPDKIVNEEGAMSACDFNMTVGGIGSTSVNFVVTGIAAKTIDWCVVGLYCVSQP